MSATALKRRGWIAAMAAALIAAPALLAQTTMMPPRDDVARDELRDLMARYDQALVELDEAQAEVVRLEATVAQMTDWITHLRMAYARTGEARYFRMLVYANARLDKYERVLAEASGEVEDLLREIAWLEEEIAVVRAQLGDRTDRPSKPTIPSKGRKTTR